MMIHLPSSSLHSRSRPWVLIFFRNNGKLVSFGWPSVHIHCTHHVDNLRFILFFSRGDVSQGEMFSLIEVFFIVLINGFIRLQGSLEVMVMLLCMDSFIYRRNSQDGSSLMTVFILLALLMLIFKYKCLISLTLESSCMGD